MTDQYKCKSYFDETNVLKDCTCGKCGNTQKNVQQKEIEVEKIVLFLKREKLWSISLRTLKPYGEYYPRTIYITAIFHRKLDKALDTAWKEFYKSKKYQDDNDEMYRNKKSEIVKLTVSPN